VKTSTALLCGSLLGVCLCLPAIAQDDSPQAPQPAQTPPAQTTPPAQPQDQPAPTTTRGIRAAPPALPKIPDVRQPGETGYWINVMGWFPNETPYIDKGHAATFTDASKIHLQGKPKYSRGAEVGLALGLHNALRFSYFDSRGSGTTTAPADTVLWSQVYTAGTLLTTDHRVQNAKISFEYLTWPYPVESRKFRLKTLWQLQYTSVRSGFDAPLLPLVDSAGNPLVDASGNPLSYAGSGTRWFMSPTFGVGVSEFATRHFRLEANGSGFAIPHHWTIWDADASANFKYGHLEIRVGAKAFHYKTSTAAEFFLRNTMAAPFVGIRWYSQ